MSRELILERIRTSLKRGEGEAEARLRVAQRIENHAPNVSPQRGQLPFERRLELFVTLARDLGVTTERLATPAAVPAALARYLERRSFEKKVKLSPHPELRALPWAAESIETRSGPAEESDMIGVSVAFCGIAETGSLMFLSGADTPIAMCFLPPTHVVLLHTRDLVGTFEEAWTMLRRGRAPRSMPRTTLFVTGTSATGDVGQVLVKGASGPLSLQLFLVDDPL